MQYPVLVSKPLLQCDYRVLHLSLAQQITINEEPLDKGIPIPVFFAWRIPWTKKPGRLQSMKSQRGDTTEQVTLSLSLSHLNYLNLLI